MIGKLCFFLVSLVASCILCYIASNLKASGIKERKMKGLQRLCFALPFWLILTSVKMLISAEYLAIAIVAQQVSVNVVIYMTLWFILHLIENKYANSRIVFALIVGIPAIDNILLLTNHLHMQYFTSYEPMMTRYFLPEGPLFNIRLAVMIAAILTVYLLFFKYIIKNFKSRPILLLSGIGVVIPLILNLIYLYGGFEYDFTAFSYLFTVFFFAYTCYAPRLQKARLGLFNETLAKIAKSQSISLGETQDVARLITYEGCIALDAYRVGIWSYDEDEQIFKSIICYNSLTGQYSILDDFNIYNLPQYKELLATEKLIIINDTKAPNALSGSLSAYDSNICSLMQAPIKIGQRLTGLVSVVQNYSFSFPEKRDWNTEEQTFALSLADLMAIAISNKERQILKDAESASKAKSQFITNISHEIRTPMNAVIGMVELALRENDIELKNEHLKIVKQAGTHLMSIINDILDFSKIESGRQEIIQEEYSVASLLDEIINITCMNIGDSGVRFSVKADNNIPRMLYGDEAKIRQAIINILDNAVKFTTRGYVSFGVYGEIINNDTMNLIFVIIDTGIGIKEEDIDLLFEDFSQVENENNQTVKGIGLGLPITKNIVNAMGGKISVNSEFGKGSTFTISLPQKYHSHDAMAYIKKPENKCVLIFERRDIYAESLAYTVKNLGADCVFVSSGTELFNKMESRKFDYLFISYGLYVKNEDTIIKFGADTEVLILADFNEVIYNKNLKVITMPVYCTIIAEVLNGIYENVMLSAEEDSSVKFTAPEAKVLIVDDINTNLKVAQGLLMPYHMQIDLCNNGAESVEKMKIVNYDIVFMDHRMPGVDGVEATRRIREWEKSSRSSRKPIPIVALTANAVLGMKEMFLKNGFNDYLPKPIDTVLLNEILEKWIPKEKQEGISL